MRFHYIESLLQLFSWQSYGIINEQLLYNSIFFLCSVRQKEKGRYFVNRKFFCPLSPFPASWQAGKLGLEVLT